MKISVLLFSFAGTAAAFWPLLFVSDARASPTLAQAPVRWPSHPVLTDGEPTARGKDALAHAQGWRPIEGVLSSRSRSQPQ